MVGDNTERNVRSVAVAVFNVCNFADLFHNVADCVNLKNIAYTLHNARKTLKTHTGVDIRVRQTVVISVFVLVKLREYKVPEFNISVTFTADLAVGFSAAVFFAAVKIYFRAGSARALSDFPEIVLFSHTHNSVGRNAHFFRPDVKSLVVVLINCNPKLVHGKFQNLGAEFPRPRSSLIFEIIAERKVSEHFKICAVARSFAHAFNIGRSDTFLARCNALPRRNFLTGEVRLKRRHAGVYKKQAVVILRNKRK